MKYTLNILLILGISIYTFGQVGVNTLTPKSNLHILKSNNSQNPEGLLVPRLTKSQLALKDTYGNNQNSTLVFITNITGGTTGPSATQVTNINKIGFYYFSSADNKWKNIIPDNIDNLYTNIYKGNGEIESPRIVSQDAYNISFNSNKSDGFSIGTNPASPTLSINTQNKTVGIGKTPETNNPASLDINNGFKLQDGTQASGKYLVSDNNGNGSWQTINSNIEIIQGYILKDINTGNDIDEITFDGGKYLDSYIILNKGKWLVQVGYTVESYLTPSTRNTQWIQSYLKGQNNGNIPFPGTETTPTTAQFLTTSALISNWTAPALIDGAGTSFASGVIPIEIFEDNVIIELRGRIYSIGIPQSENIIPKIINKPENYFFATKIN